MATFNQYPELALQTVPLPRVKTAIQWAAIHRSHRAFSLRLLSDTSAYVAEWRRYALART